MKAGKWSEAEASIRKALELNPEYPSAHFQLGVIHLAQSKPREALGEMQKESDPSWQLDGLALAYHALGKKREADATLNQVIQELQDDSAYQIAENLSVSPGARQSL